MWINVEIFCFNEIFYVASLASLQIWGKTKKPLIRTSFKCRMGKGTVTLVSILNTVRILYLTTV
jgi:hypothetical protein